MTNCIGKQRGAIFCRGTGVTAKSRNLLDQVYVVKETPIVSGSNKTGKSRNLLDQVYVVKENPIVSESDFWMEKKAQQDNANR